MISRVLLDAGPLITFLNRRETYHSWTVEQWRRIGTPMITCEPVLSEACFLSRRMPGSWRDIMSLVCSDLVRVEFRLQQEATSVVGLMARYSDVPMSLADACLVRMAELNPGSSVLTLDSHFRIYRMHGRQVIPTIMPGK